MAGSKHQQDPMRNFSSWLWVVVLFASGKDADLSLDAVQYQTPQRPAITQSLFLDVRGKSQHQELQQHDAPVIITGHAVRNIAVKPELMVCNTAFGVPNVVEQPPVFSPSDDRSSSPPIVLAGCPPCVLSDVSSDGPQEHAHSCQVRKLQGTGLGRDGSVLGKRMPFQKGAADKWMDFEQARRAVRSLFFTRRADFWEWWKRERPFDLPYNPDKAYR